MNKYLFQDIVIGSEGLLKGPFGSDLKKSLYVPKNTDTYKVYLQENILLKNNNVGHYYISKEYYDSKMKRYAVKENDFIVTCDGTLGEIYQLKNIKEEGIISSSLLKVTLNPDIVDYDYFYYYFKFYIKKALTTKGNNSVLKHLPGIETIKQLVIELPNLSVQKQIGKILKNIDEKIDINNKVNMELENLAKLVYDYWFLQFEFPNDDGNPYKSSGGKMVYNNLLKKEIPKNWKVKKVRDILSKIPSTDNIKKSEYKNNGIIPIIDQSSEFICGYTDRIETMLHLKNSIVFGDHTKFVKYINFDFARGSDGTQILNSNTVCLSNYLLYQQIKEFNLLSQGYSRYFKFLKDKYIIIPSEKTNNDYLILTEPINEMVKNNIIDNKQLVNLREYLLPLLMNGQVSFKD